jgi:uncharacterized repeat protein (TIGR01451 family)
VCTDVPVGTTYTVTETGPPDGFSREDLECNSVGTTPGGSAMTNLAAGTATITLTDASQHIECVYTNLQLAPALVQNKTVSPTGTVSPGAVLTYTVTVQNTGTAAAHNVVATDTLPTQVTWVSNAPSLGTATAPVGGLITWNIGTINPNQTVTLDITVTVNQSTAGMTALNRFRVTEHPDAPPPVVMNPCTDTPTDSCAQNPIVEAALVQNKTVSPTGPVLPGATLVYTVTVQNTGTAEAHGVVATDTLPTQVTWVSNAPSVGTATAPVGGLITWTIGTIEPSQTVTLDITVTVNQSTTGMTALNRFRITEHPDAPDVEVENPCVDTPTDSCAQNPIPAATPTPTPTGTPPATATPRPTPPPGVPGISLVKSANPTSTDVGGTFTFTLVVTNLSTGPAPT